MTRLRLYLKKNFFIYKTYYILTHSGKWMNHFLVNAKTDLCFEGYPSSGNSFFHALMNHVNPRLSIAHHTHSLANIRQGIKKKIPTLVIIRKPEEAISSRVIRFGTPQDIKIFTREYIDFYRTVHQNIDSLTVLPFEMMIRDIRSGLNYVQRKTGLTFDLSDLENKVSEVRIYMKVWANEHGSPERISLPDPERDSRKEEIKDILKGEELLTVCNDWYRKLISPISLNEPIE